MSTAQTSRTMDQNRLHVGHCGRSSSVSPREASEAELAAAFAQRFILPHGLAVPLSDALRDILRRTGEMVRPRIAFQVATTYGCPRAHAMDLAIAIEYFHTASLLFDDLPCMDNASTRRGSPCTHIAYGESTTILAALALVNRGYALLWSATRDAAPDRQQLALQYLERQLGVHGLLQGQSLDLHYHALPHTLQSAERAARGKTVPLIALALVLPATLCDAPPRQIQLLQRISLCWGLAYQIADDLKDVLRTPVEAGKTTDHDAALGRPNIALLLGIPAAVERLSQWMCAGDRTLDQLCFANQSMTFLHQFRGVLKDELTLLLECAGAVPIDRKR